jgi:nucleotide-binding universal stress UspA family protein
MTPAESLALGCGMNARGSTEVIVASIGLSMGVLNQDLFTAIIAMAVLTTMSMPPLLRWALGRIPLNADEEARLQREEIEAKGFFSNVERLLVAVDASPSGQFVSRLVGLLAGARRMATTVLHFDYGSAESAEEGAREAERTKRVVGESAKLGQEVDSDRPGDRAEITTRIEEPVAEIIASEAEKGYGLLLIGREPASEGGTFHPQIARSAADFPGSFAVAIARGVDRENRSGIPFDILVPVIGTAVSRHGAELAVSLARASQGMVTALYVDTGQRPQRSWSRRMGAAIAPRSSAEAIIRDVVRLGDPYGVEVRGRTRLAADPADAILRQVAIGRHNLLVLGVSPRPGEHLSFGQVAADLLERAKCSILFIASEPFEAGAQDETHPEASKPGARRAA